MSLLANSNAIESGGYNIERSLRFRSSASAYLDRTQTSSVTNNNKWTFSCWVKRGAIGTTTSLLSSYSGTGASQIYFDANDKLRVFIPDNGGATKLDYVTTQVFRDPSAFYHIVISLDNTLATSVLSLAVNGASVTSFSTSTNSLVQNGNYQINKASTPMIVGEIYNNGASGTLASGYYFDGYLAEVNFIDGQALTPSSFGYTEPVTGVWQPIKYTGTYGTNGFYLPFSDNTSATTLAYDKSGNGNDWTANNISTTAGATYDSMTDVPTLTSATAANFATWNPLSSKAAFSLGSANLYAPSTDNKAANGTIGVSSGKWYWEITNSASPVTYMGVTSYQYENDPDSAPTMADNAGRSIIGGNYSNPSRKNYTATSTTTGWTTLQTSATYGFALDIGAGTLAYYEDNTLLYTDTTIPTSGVTLFPYIGHTYSGANSWGQTNANFGQRPFSYTPPTGFVALNTFNLPDPTIKKPNQYMDATTYTGTGASLSITNAAGFQPDLVWAKGRSGATDHALYDSVRGVQKQLESNNTDAETTETTGLTAFNSNGFTVGALAQVNTNTATYVGWQWKKGATPGFDIVTYTGTGGSGTRTVAHSLGVAPAMTIIKKRSGTAQSWQIWHKDLTSYAYELYFDTSAQQLDNQFTALPSSTVLSISAGTGMNTLNETYVAYLFAEIPQFSKAFSFTGNASTDGSFVHLGFNPKAILLKCSSTTGNWYLFDTVRNTYNVLGEQLYPNLSNAGSTVTTLDALSNGFKMRLTGDPNAAQNYIGFAWADSPLKYSLAR